MPQALCQANLGHNLDKLLPRDRIHKVYYLVIHRAILKTLKYTHKFTVENSCQREIQSLFGGKTFHGALMNTADP